MTISLKIPQPNFTKLKEYPYREFTHRFLQPDGVHGVCLAVEVIDDNEQPVWYTERPTVAWHRPWTSFGLEWHVAQPQYLSSPQAREKFEAVAERAGFTYYPAQKEALTKAVAREGNVLLIGDTGTGKTLMGSSLLNYYTTDKENPLSLVVVPQAVIPQWKAELHRFFPQLPVWTMDDWKPGYPGIVIVHPQRLFHNPREDVHALLASRFAVALVDEAHMYGAEDSMLAVGMFRIHADTRIALSATPIANRVGELFHVLRWLQPTKFPYNSAERQRFIDDCFTSDGSPTLQKDKVLTPFVVTLEKHECRAEVPVMHLTKIKLIVGPELRAKLNGASAERQRQLLWTREAQDQKTIQLLRALAYVTDTGEQLVVVCARTQQTDEYAAILGQLGITYSRIDSETNPKNHAWEAASFKEKKTRVMLMGSRCAQSHSFDQCKNLFIGSMGYSYAEFWQTVGRIWRVTSKEPIRVFLPYYPETIESKLWEYVTTKQQLARNTLFPVSNLAEYIKEMEFYAKPVGSLSEERTSVDIWISILKRCLDRKAAVSSV